MPEPATPAPLRGVLMLAGAALCMSLAVLLAKLMSRGISSPELVLLRSLFMVIVVGAWARARGEPLFPRRGRLAALFLARGLLGTVGFLLFFEALRRISMADTVILFQAHPAVVALLSPLLLKERLRLGQLLLVLGSVAGVGLVVAPSGQGSLDGRLLAVGCAVTTGFAVALVRILSRSLPTLTNALAFPLVAVATMGPALLAGLPWLSWGTPSPRDWGLIGAFAALSTTGQVLITAGIGCVPAARGAPIANLQVVFALVLGYLFLGEVPSPWSLLGASVVVTCLVLLARRKVEPGEEATC